MDTLLVIERDNEFRSLVVELLELEGYKAIGAENGLDAIIQARTYVPDLILYGLPLSGPEGYSVLEWLRRYPSTTDIPIVMLVYRLSASHTDRLYHLGIEDYLMKPFVPEDLLAIIRACLHLHKMKRNTSDSGSYRTQVLPCDSMTYRHAQTLPFYNGLKRQHPSCPRLDDAHKRLKRRH